MYNDITVSITTPVSYIIYIEHSTIKAVNGSTGAVDYSSSDAANVINNAISALPNGGKIYIKEGIYLLNTAILIKRKNGFQANTIIEGASYGTELKLSNGAINDIIAVESNLGTSNFIIRNLKLNGNKSNAPLGGRGIDLGTNIWNVIVEKIFVQDCHDYNIYANGGTTVTLRNIHTIRSDLTNIYAKGIGYIIEDIISEAGATNKWAADIGNDGGTLKNIYIEQCDYGLFLDGFNNSHAEGILTTAVTQNYDLKIDYSSKSTISGLHLGRSETNGYLVVDNHSSDITIIGGGYTKVTDLATNTRFIGANRDYITKSNVLSDTFTIDSTGIKTVTIPHGLAITPNVQDCYLTVVQNTAVDDWAYDLLKVVSTNATNVTTKINISTASATVGATAKLALKVGY